MRKAWGKQPGYRLRAEDTDQGDERQHCAEPTRGGIDQGFGLRPRPLAAVLAEHRNKGLGKGALGEQPAQEIGNFESDEERVRPARGAGQARDHHIAQQAKDPGDQGQGTNECAGAEQTGPTGFGLGHLCSNGCGDSTRMARLALQYTLSIHTRRTCCVRQWVGRKLKSLDACTLGAAQGKGTDSGHMGSGR